MQLFIEEYPHDIDLESLFAACYGEQPYSFWLDGNDDERGRYSYMGGDPFFILESWGERYRLRNMRSGEVNDGEGDPFSSVQQILEQLQVDHIESDNEEIPFLAGGVGYFSFENKSFAEPVTQTRENGEDIPDSCWIFVDKMLIYDRKERRTWLSKWQLQEESVQEARDALKAFRQGIFEQHEFRLASLTETWDAGSLQHWADQLEVQMEDKIHYREKLRRIQEHIGRGDIYQACYTYPVRTLLQADSWTLYRILRQLNPAPFSAYLRLNGVEVLSSSPERLLRCYQDGRMVSSPIKGTRPRGKSIEEDEILRFQLGHHEKDRAENVMIVDLVRNDFGKIATTGSVSVPQLLEVETYATVHQLVSTVEAKLQAGLNPLDAVRAVFPGGSMTGAPKIRALEILAELESSPRGIYAGGLGYCDVRGGLDLCMVIRTIICQKGMATFHVGGGIVADSDIEAEFCETEDKGLALKAAIAMANAIYHSSMDNSKK
ncbi:aminodeoxychorismate synthase component I [Mechercharimyces sp. CAU 1602]|uniref:aminodeoxychorismate synthase component I n=1 Tax=Mechercharimyces sp. CAU 1602 TaxID=2973933 RepID=UPI002163937A|nr:aminodeoxychorismate synthase component I [Mechercharimyces sp. CAU 1602]MCS1352030.1 aminodeoxychorismate synthase component I [Mechercharimyces sp. CAU 1602]